VDNVLAELEHIVDGYGIREISFADPTFNLDNHRVADLCERIICARIDVLWDCLFRLDQIDERSLRLIHRAGCRYMSFGVETGSERILREEKKTLKPELSKKQSL